MHRVVAAAFTVGLLLGGTGSREAEAQSFEGGAGIRPSHTIVSAELLVDGRFLIGGLAVQTIDEVAEVADSLRRTRSVFRISSGLGVPRTRLVEMMSMASRAGYADIEVDSRRYVRPRVTLDVVGDARYFLNDVEVGVAELRTALERAKLELDTDLVVITPSTDASMGAVNTAMRTARDAGLQSFQIMSDTLGKTNPVDGDQGHLEIMDEPTLEEKIQRLVDLYQEMRPDLAAQVLELASEMEDSTKAHVLWRLPHRTAREILDRLPESSALRLRDKTRELSPR